MAAEPVPQFPIRTVNPAPANIDAAVGIVDSGGTNLLGVDASGRITVKLTDGSGNALTSDAGILNIDISEQSLTALKISATSAANAVGNPIFVQRSDGSAALGTTANPDNSAIVVGGAVKGAVGAPFYVALTDGTAAYGETANPLGIEIVVGGAVKGAVGAPIFVELSDGSAAFGTSGNPIFVTEVVAASGTLKREVNLGSNVTSGSSTNADFTVPADKVWEIYSIEMSAGEFGHFDITLDPAGTPVQLGTIFVAGGQTYLKTFPQTPYPTLTEGKVLRVVKNNDSNQDAKFAVNVTLRETAE